MKKFLSHTIAFLFIFYAFIVCPGCAKEYSDESIPVPGSTMQPDTTGTRDTAQGPGVFLPYCNACVNINPAAGLSWSFKADTAVLCGSVTNGVVSPDGEGMTFFGPSSCSNDNGLIITAFFNEPIFKTDQNHLVTTNVTLQYYDKRGISDLLQSKRPHILSLTIDTYSQVTKLATGNFTGSVINRAGDVTVIDAGRFRVRF